MSINVLWEKTLNSKYNCKCSSDNPFFGKLTVTDIENDITILDKMLVLKGPLNFEKWESFCQSAVDAL